MLQKLRIILLLFLGLFLAAPDLGYARDSAGSIKELGIEAAKKEIENRGKNLVIVDVRTPGEFREGHLAGAENVNLFGTRFEEQVEKLPRDKSLLVYCRTGKRSAGAADIFKEKGFEVLHMKDGIVGWEKAKLPLVKD